MHEMFKFSFKNTFTNFLILNHNVLNDENHVYLFEFLVLVVIVKGDEGRRSLHVIKEV